MRFSSHEIKDLLIAWFGISAAFGVLFYSSWNNIVIAGGIAAVTVGLGFFLHELGHKYVAQKYGCWAEFRANYMMLLLAIAMSFFGFVFAAPGAVFISSTRPISKKKMGHIGFAGPVVNILLAIPFAAAYFIFPDEILRKVMMQGMFINIWLALFNMLPFHPFDGKKILDWSKWVYGLFTALCFLLFLALVL